MAQKSTSQRSGSRNGRSASSRSGNRSSTRNTQGGDGARPALQARREINDADREYRQYERREEQDRVGPPDVLLDVPELKVDSVHFELDDLDAHIALKARVLNLVKLNVGIDVHLTRCKLDIKGVEAEVVLKARLEHVTAIVDRLMTSLDRNPELVKGLSRAVSDVGKGAGQAVDKTGDAAKEVGQGAQSALKDVGQGAGQAVGDVGQGAGQAAGNLGQVVGGVGQMVGQAGQQVTGALGGAGQGGGDGAQGAGQAGQSAAQAAQAGQGQGQSDQPGQGNGQPAGQSDGAGGSGAKARGMAKEVAKRVAGEIRQAASEEARDLGLAATRKVRELGERREHRRAEKYHATETALRVADELGIDLAGVEGTGSEGRITAKDVRQAQEA